MSKIKVLLVGESWVSTTTHVKGFDKFSTTEYQIGIGGLLTALDGSEIDLVHMPGHDVPTAFPQTREGLSSYDVAVISDVGANSILLHPDTFVRGKRTPNRLRLISDWVADGGGFMMIGGYYSFQGLNGAARYQGTAIETILPVSMHPFDDRMEIPEGFTPQLRNSHAAITGIPRDWPFLLGYNQVKLKEGADLVLTAGAIDDPLLACGHFGKGRTAAWTSDIGPHWLPQEFMDWPGYSLLWKQLFAWLAKRS